MTTDQINRSTAFEPVSVHSGVWTADISGFTQDKNLLFVSVFLLHPLLEQLKILSPKIQNNPFFAFCENNMHILKTSLSVMLVVPIKICIGDTSLTVVKDLSVCNLKPLLLSSERSYILQFPLDSEQRCLCWQKSSFSPRLTLPAISYCYIFGYLLVFVAVACAIKHEVVAQLTATVWNIYKVVVVNKIFDVSEEEMEIVYRFVKRHLFEQTSFYSTNVFGWQ